MSWKREGRESQVEGVRGRADCPGQVPNLEPDSQAERMVFSQPGCGKQVSNETPHEII